MRLLLTNDDGIDAPGLAALADAVRFAAERCQWNEEVDVVVVAPDRCRSECGHGVTSSRPLVVKQPRPNWYCVDGTPVDCVRAALSSLCPDVDLVLSGVNAGANLGIDLLVSGTFAAAREASLLGVAAMAISQYRHPDAPRTWEHVSRWLCETLCEFVLKVARQDSSEGLGHKKALLWNVNLPAIDPEVAQPPRYFCPVDLTPMIRTAHFDQSTMSFQSDFHRRSRQPGTDVDRCFAGAITISQIDTIL